MQGKVVSRDLKTSFLNTRNGVIPTGVIMSVAPFAIATVLGGAGIVTFYMRKKMRKMNLIKKIKGSILVFTLLICTEFGLIEMNKVYAADINTAAIQIPISCIGTGTNEEFFYYLEGEKSESEIPEATKLCLKNGEKGRFVIHYTEPGIYHYQIHQEAGADRGVTYDNTIYNVDVYVMAGEEGALFAEPILYVEGQTQKKAEPEFVNTKAESLGRQTGPKTGDQSNKKIMTILTVNILSVITVILCGKRKEKNAKRVDKK